MALKQHPTKPDMMIYTKTEYGNISIDDDYERGFIDGMQKQMQSSVDKAVNAMSKKEWVGLTDEEIKDAWSQLWYDLNNGKFAATDDPSRHTNVMFARAIEAKLKEKNT